MLQPESLAASRAFLVWRFHAEEPVYGDVVAYTQIPYWLPWIRENVGGMTSETMKSVRQKCLEQQAEFEAALPGLATATRPDVSDADWQRARNVVEALRAYPAPATRAEYARFLKGAKKLAALTGERERPGFGLLADWPETRIKWALECLYWAGVLQVPADPWWALLSDASKKKNALHDGAARLFFPAG